MLKVLIADDETRIREGIVEAVPWESLGAAVTAVARNGAEAWELFKEHRPEICLIDICMPLLSGLELIEKIREENADTVCIIITGYDEFEYAHNAIKMHVFDYILKPVSEQKLVELIKKAADFVKQQKSNEEKLNMAKQLLERNLPILKDKFLNDLINGYLVEEEIKEHLLLHRMEFKNQIGLIVLSLDKPTVDVGSESEWNRQMRIFSARSAFESRVKSIGYFAASIDRRENIFAFVSIDDEKAWENISTLLEKNIQSQLNLIVKVVKARLSFGLVSAAEVYEVLVRDSERRFSEIIKGAREYIEKKLSDSNFSFTELAEYLCVSESYLSKLFKKEIGMTFSDYLTRVRIQKAHEYMSNPSLKIYEIAELTGYKSQHYFCTAFKRVIGKSPTEYRNFH